MTTGVICLVGSESRGCQGCHEVGGRGFDLGQQPDELDAPTIGDVILIDIADHRVCYPFLTATAGTKRISWKELG